MRRPSGRIASLQTRQEWTARFDRVCDLGTREEQQAIFGHAQRINPGGTVRSMLEAWGYSAAGRGRKKANEIDQAEAPARERLENALKDLFGRDRSPVRSLYPKLAGTTHATVRDVARIVAALLVAWPEPLKMMADAKTADERRRRARQTAEDLIRVLLAELSSGRSFEWTAADMDGHGFRLAQEERVGAAPFIKEVSERVGALIVASAKDLLVGATPIDALRGFHSLTGHFAEEDGKGLLIFVFDAGLFDAGDERFAQLYNLGHFASAVTAFALFQDELDETHTVRLYKVDWSRWQRLAQRCCIVMRRAPLIDPMTGELLARQAVDDFIAQWQPSRPFDRLRDVDPIVSFDASHVLPRTYPEELDASQTWSGRALYWDVTVRPCKDEPDGLKVEFFIPPAQPSSAAPDANGTKISFQDERTGPGRRPMQSRPIEGDMHYIIRRNSPGPQYDGAQRAIYMAARARLHLDTGKRHEENLMAAAALREIGFEVLPIAVAMSLLPRSLYYAATLEQQSTKKAR